MSTQGLLERSNGYYFQARIPKQYLPHYPKQIIREKLPTENRKKAVALVPKRWAAEFVAADFACASLFIRSVEVGVACVVV